MIGAAGEETIRQRRKIIKWAEEKMSSRKALDGSTIRNIQIAAELVVIPPHWAKIRSQRLAQRRPRSLPPVSRYRDRIWTALAPLVPASLVECLLKPDVYLAFRQKCLRETALRSAQQR